MRSSSRWSGVLLVVSVALARAAGAGTVEGMVFVADGSNDTVVGFLDLDGSGSWEPGTADVKTTFFDPVASGVSLSIAYDLVVAEDGALLVVDGGTTDRVLAIRDSNGDGDANDPGEQTVFFDGSNSERVRMGIPNAIAACADGSYLIGDKGSRTHGLIAVRDIDEDGTALGAGESSVVLDNTNASGVVFASIDSLAVDERGVVYVGDSTLQAVFGCQDVDGDGRFQGAGEVWLCVQGGEDRPLTNLSALVAGIDGALYAADKPTGTLWRFVDLNGDGDSVDEGESAVFVGSGAAVGTRDTNDVLQLADGTFVLLVNSSDAIVLAKDLDGDGNANGPGETANLLGDGGECLSQPVAIAIGPAGDEEPPARRFTRGDVNEDGRMELTDGVVTLNHLFLGGAISTCADAADSDDDGRVNISDPIYVLNFLFLGGPAPLPPFPDPGTDPTPDALACE